MWKCREQEILHRISSKLDSDFKLLQQRNNTNLLNKLMSRTAWLYTSTPQNIVSHIRTILQKGFPLKGWNSAVEAASRVFVNIEDFELLFKSIAQRAQSNPSEERTFSRSNLHSICRVLDVQKGWGKALDKKWLNSSPAVPCKDCSRRRENAILPCSTSKLFGSFFYLLRYRRSDPSCFDPSVPQTVYVFEAAQKAWRSRKTYYLCIIPRLGRFKNHRWI